MVRRREDLAYCALAVALTVICACTNMAITAMHSEDAMATIDELVPVMASSAQDNAAG